MRVLCVIVCVKSVLYRPSVVKCDVVESEALALYTLFTNLQHTHTHHTLLLYCMLLLVAAQADIQSGS